MPAADKTPGTDQVLGPVLTEDGSFQIQDAEFDLSDTTIEGWAALLFFWALAGTVFVQFFTRYVINDSAAWTEEIARYLLIAVVFIGAAIGVSKNNHIHVDYFYRLIPAPLARVLSTAVDAIRIAFFAACVVLTAQMMMKMGNYQMTVVDLPMNLVYGVCLAGFAAMFIRSIILALQHWRRGWSLLERPGTEDG